MLSPVKGYSALMTAYYDTIDFSLFLKSVLMPIYDSAYYDSCLVDESNDFLTDEKENVLTYRKNSITATSAKEQVALLTQDALSPVAVANISVVSSTTAKNAVESIAKTIVKSTYKVEAIAIDDAEAENGLIKDGDLRYWKGNFKVTNYSDEDDIAYSEVVIIEINDDLESFMQQKIDKALNKEDTDDLSISGLFKKDYDDFCAELKKYALSFLETFEESCRGCLTILQEQGVGNKDTWGNTEEGSESNLYEKLYLPYYNKLAAIEAETSVRDKEIADIESLQTNIEEYKAEMQEVLDFKNFLKDDDLWIEFCSYRKEDKYSNENYISDGLNNAQLFEKALAFYEVAENEIYKSAELQHSISTTLNNLLAIPKFKPLVKSFKVGNWIRVRVDDRIYKLRLLEYDIDFGNFDNIPVEFSDVTKIKNGITDTRDALSQASSMASSYNSVKRQANQGEKSNATLNSWISEGLKATDTKIVDSADENLLFDKYGFWCKQYDPISGTYSPEQIKIIGSTIAITDDNWENTKTAIGKFYYYDPITGEEKIGYGINGEVIVGQLFIGEDLILSNSNGKLTFDDNGFIVSGNGESIVKIQPNEEESIFSIKNNDGEYVLYLNQDTGNLYIKGDIVTTNLEVDSTNGTITGFSNVAISGDYSDLDDVPTKLSDFENDGVFITKDANNLTNYYKKSETYSQTQTDNLLSAKANTIDLATIATSGSYNDLVDIDELKSWVLEQIQSAINQQTN